MTSSPRIRLPASATGLWAFLTPLLLFLGGLPGGLPAQEGAVGFNRYATVEAKIVGLQVEDRWICPGEAVDVCDLERAAAPPEADLVGSVSNLSYDRDGFGRGDYGEIRVDIEQPSIFDPFTITGRVTRWEFRPSMWKEYVLSSLRRGFRDDVLVVDDSTTVEATLWFLHLPIEVQLGWEDDPGFFSRNELSESYGRVQVLVRLEPRTDQSVYLREAGRERPGSRLEDLYMGPHAVEAAAVSHWGSRGRNAPGTTGLRWNAGGERPLALDPERVWGFPLAPAERERIDAGAGAADSGDVLPGIRRGRSWFDRPVYFTVDFTRLGSSRQEVDVGAGDRERRWVGDQAYVDAAIHTYVIGEWTNRPVEVLAGTEVGPVQGEDRSWRSLFAGLGDWIPDQLRRWVLFPALALVGVVLVVGFIPRLTYGLGAAIRNFLRGLRGL